MKLHLKILALKTNNLLIPNNSRFFFDKNGNFTHIDGYYLDSKENVRLKDFHWSEIR